MPVVSPARQSTDWHPCQEGGQRSACQIKNIKKSKLFISYLFAPLAGDCFLVTSFFNFISPKNNLFHHERQPFTKIAQELYCYDGQRRCRHYC
jgi:hypothetical protein